MTYLDPITHDEIEMVGVKGVPDVRRPWLRLGEILHVGKGTSFGLGWYRIL